jgi:hypothetical protein
VAGIAPPLARLCAAAHFKMALTATRMNWNSGVALIILGQKSRFGLQPFADDAGRTLVGRFGFFSSCRPPPLRSLLLSDPAECAIELPLLALLRVLLGRLARGAVRHWSAVIGERRLELFTQLSLGQLRRLWHSGPFENPRERCGQKRASE